MFSAKLKGIPLFPDQEKNDPQRDGRLSGSFQSIFQLQPFDLPA
jgi:hypothetical protein